MAWVITEPCRCTKLAACVEHCPERAIIPAPGEDQYVIDPLRCTDCGGCDQSCPVAAIFPDFAVPEEWRHYIERNALLAARAHQGTA